MQLVADGGYLVAGPAIHAVIHPLQVPLWIDLTSVVVAALAGAAVAVAEGPEAPLRFLASSGFLPGRWKYSTADFRKAGDRE